MLEQRVGLLDRGEIRPTRRVRQFAAVQIEITAIRIIENHERAAWPQHAAGLGDVPHRKLTTSLDEIGEYIGSKDQIHARGAKSSEIAPGRDLQAHIR